MFRQKELREVKWKECNCRGRQGIQEGSPRRQHGENVSGDGEWEAIRRVTVEEAKGEVEDERSRHPREEGVSGGKGSPLPRESTRISLGHFLKETPEPGNRMGACESLRGGSRGEREAVMCAAGGPVAPAPLLHGMDGTGADERPHMKGEGGGGAGGEGHEPDMLPGYGNPWEPKLQLIPDCPSGGAVPEHMAAAQVGAEAAASGVRRWRLRARGVTAGAVTIGADVMATRPGHPVDGEAPPHLLVHGRPGKSP